MSLQINLRHCRSFETVEHTSRPSDIGLTFVSPSTGFVYLTLHEKLHLRIAQLKFARSEEHTMAVDRVMLLDCLTSSARYQLTSPITVRWTPLTNVGLKPGETPSKVVRHRLTEVLKRTMDDKGGWSWKWASRDFIPNDPDPIPKIKAEPFIVVRNLDVFSPLPSRVNKQTFPWLGSDSSGHEGTPGLYLFVDPKTAIRLFTGTADYSQLGVMGSAVNIDSSAYYPLERPITFTFYPNCDKLQAKF